jgi:hypothetical protein
MSMKFYSRCLDIDRTFGPFLVPALCVVVSRTLSQCHVLGLVNSKTCYHCCFW